MRGIKSYAGYVPYRRLDRAAIAQFFGGAPRRGQRSVASFDEDTTTMAFEAARLALRAVEQMADDPTNHVLMDLQPGDMQFINNYHVLHARTAYEDDRSAGHVRHLKRLWLETTVLTSRPPYFANNRNHWSEKRSASRLEVR